MSWKYYKRVWEDGTVDIYRSNGIEIHFRGFIGSKNFKNYTSDNKWNVSRYLNIDAFIEEHKRHSEPKLIEMTEEEVFEMFL